MSNKNRGDRIRLLHKVVLKHFTPVPRSEDRSVLENLVYACCLEDADYEQADEAFHRLQESFFDWNEIRVTTVTELQEKVHNLPDPAAAAMRVKKNLQSLFESRYSFDLDDMVKMNQGKAVQELEAMAGMTRFILGYVVQNSLGGHSIPVSKTIMQIMLATEIVSENEAAKGQVPGLERTVPKTKGITFASCLHQLAVAHASSPNSKSVLAILKEAGAPDKKPAKETKKKAAAKKSATKKAATKPETPEPQKAKKSTKKAVVSGKTASTTKKTAKKSTKAASPKSKPAAKPATKKTKRKPR